MEPEEVYQKRDIMLAEIHSDVKNLVKNFESHLIDDKETAKDIRDKIEFHQKIVYGGIGILGAIEVLSKFIK